MTTPPVLVLLPSPFLGPASLQPLADAIGASTYVVDLRTAESPVHDGLLDAFEAGVAELPGPLVLVAHSGSGPLLPGFAARATRQDVTALIYLDAGLPTPGRSWADTVPRELLDALQAAAVGDRLPPWSSWFEPDPLVSLVPDTGLRERIAAEQPGVPIAFLTEPRPDVTADTPSAYLQLSEGYVDDADRTDELGWPVRRLDTHHLAATTDPDVVAAALSELLEAISGPTGGSGRTLG